MKEWKEYYKEHPDATLKEYNDYCEQTSKYMVDREIKIKAYFKSLVGKYFLVDHNGSSFEVFKYDKENDRNTKYDRWRFYYTDSGVAVCKELGYINTSWFNNPYLGYKNTGVRFCEEITEEQYNDIVSECSRLLNTTESKFKQLWELKK